MQLKDETDRTKGKLLARLSGALDHPRPREVWDDMKECGRTMRDLQCWEFAFDSLERRDDLGHKLLVFWQGCGTDLFYGYPDASLSFIDRLRSLLPPCEADALTLYRGETNEMHVNKRYGISWTPDMIVARVPETFIQYEEEYLVDPRLVRCVTVIV